MAARKNCEIANQISDVSNDCTSSSDDSDHDDIFCSSQSSSQNSGFKSTNAQGKLKSLQRLPTRRPDPNVCNRNALLARENRRRKKAYVQTLEQELDTMKNSNKKLHKLLRKHMKMVKKLESEKQYYKGLITNQSDILNLVSVLNTKSVLLPKASSCSPTDSYRSTSSVEPPVAINYDCNENDSSYEPYTESNWDQLLGMDDCPVPEENTVFNPTNSRCEVQSISGEHNYFNNQNGIDNDDSGLCLHITRGKISFEYCPSCHLNSKRCNNLPDQLLVVD